MRCSARSASALALAAGLGLAACGEPPVAPPVPPVGLVLTASDTVHAVGGTLRFTAVAVDSVGTAVPGYAIVWAVSDARRGRITGRGVFTAGADTGRVVVRATVLTVPPRSDSMAVRVVAPGTVKWTWAAADVGATMPIIGGVALGLDGTVYAIAETDPLADLARLVALEPDGRLRWAVDLTDTEINFPVVTPGGDILVVAERVSVFGPDGGLRWERATEATDPLSNAGASTADVVIAAHGSHVTAFRRDNGDTLWQSPWRELESWKVPPTIAQNGIVYAKATADTLYAFRLDDGTILRTFADPDTGLNKAVFGMGSVLVGERVYLPTWNRLAAFDTAGPLLWLTGQRGRGMPEPAVGPDGVLYVQNQGFGLEAINPDGTTRWYRRRVTPAGGWKEEQRWPWYGGPALAAGGIIYGAGEYGFFAYDQEGTLLWEQVADTTPDEGGFPAGAFVGAPAIGPDGTVYTFTKTHIHAFFGPAPPEPNSPWPMWRHDAQRTGWAR